MAKKKPRAAASSAATKPRPKPAKKPTTKPAKNSHEHHHHGDCHDEHCSEIEIELDDTERKTIDMVLDSQDMRIALETEANNALASAVRKFCRHYGTPLSAAQAHNVAMVLFNG